MCVCLQYVGSGGICVCVSLCVRVYIPNNSHSLQHKHNYLCCKHIILAWLIDCSLEALV